MAPPPPASLPLQQRLLAVAQTLQFAWFIGHLTLLFCALRYGLSWITFNWGSAWATFSYRTAFVAAAATYGIVVFKAYRARLRGGLGTQSGLLALAGDENVQYLAMALVWLFFHQVPLAILPFTVYSIFHVATYTRSNLIPTFQPPTMTAGPDGKPVASKPSALSDTIGKFVKQYYDLSMGLVAALEIALWFRCLFSAIIFTKGSWILLVIYTIFLRARYAQSGFVQNVVRQFTARIDSSLANQSTPPAARQAWETVKGGVKQFAAVTDIRKYLGGAPAAQPKKSH